MKKFILITFLPCWLWLVAQTLQMNSDDRMAAEVFELHDEGEDWLKNYEEALSDAKKEKRNVLVYFTGSDWCPPCKMLKKDLFDTSEFKIIAAEYTLLYIDIPRDKNLLSAEQMEHNMNLLNKINKKGVFPLLVILSEKGRLLDQYSGYSMDGKIQAHVDFLNMNKE